MSRLIDADNLTQRFYYLVDALSIESVHIDSIVQYIDNMPTVDAVEVVRCDQCRHFDAINNDDHGWCKLISDLPNGVSVRYDDDYCSYGERRVEE